MDTEESTQKIRKKPNFSKLMAEGGGLSGFAWPENCGDFEMRIAADGTWFYRNSPIGRIALVKLFATVLQRDHNGQHWLVTPAERGVVQVDDAPFVIVEMQKKERDNSQEIHMRTNLDHWVRLDSTHSLTMRQAPNSQEQRPYVHLRDGLEALINRAVYYELVETAEIEGKSLIVYSADQRFVLGCLEENNAH